MTEPKKSLGQHWLKDRAVLAQVAEYAQVSKEDTVLEIGPGLGTLTAELLRRAKRVIAVELDQSLASKLPGQFPGTSLEVVNQDILQYNLQQLPDNYSVVANVPYYITSKIITLLTTTTNKPRTIVLLVQKEVAQRLAAKPGNLSILAISAQLYAEVSLGDVVPAALFTPPPKVDSQVVVLHMRPSPLVTPEQEKKLFQLVKVGFSSKRKKLVSNLAGGLRIPKQDVEELLHHMAISPLSRAEDVSLEQWIKMAQNLQLI